jgi:NADH pyrophosphatase NudC (nudix superfamily)
MINFQDSFSFCYRCGSALIKRNDDSFICTSCSHVTYPSPSACNAVFLENDNGEILLVERGREPRKGTWDAAGGFIKPFEDYKISVRREIKEELSIEIDQIKIFGSYPDHYVYQGIDVATISIFSTAKIVSKDIKAGDDVSGYSFFTPDQALELDLSFPSIKVALQDYILFKKNMPEFE